MTTTVVTSTSRGQITLPKQWRSQFKTSNYVVQMHNDQLVIKPLQIEEDEYEEVIFDADRDNDGEGIAVEDMLELLRSIDNNG